MDRRCPPVVSCFQVLKSKGMRYIGDPTAEVDWGRHPGFSSGATRVVL
jgi:hypothetical protein